MTAVGSQPHDRVRRPSDLLLGVVAIVAVIVLFGLAHGLPIGTHELTRDVSTWIAHHVPRVLGLALAAIAGVGCVALVSVAALTLGRSDRRSLRNGAVGFIAGTAASAACVLVWRGGHAGVATAMLRGTSPGLLVVTVGYVALLTGTDLSRSPRWFRWAALTVLFLPLTELLARDLSIVAMVVAPIAGWGIGLLVRWALATASVRPPRDSVVAWLQESGVHVSALQAGKSRSRLTGTLESGNAIDVLLANRDTSGAGVVRRFWQAIRLRGSPFGAVVASSRSQLESQALACYTAAANGVLAPRVLLLAEMAPGMHVLVLRCPRGAAVHSTSSPEDLAAVFSALRLLHAAGVAHRDLRAQHLVVGPEGAGFSSMARAQTASSELARRLDVAQALTTIASECGATAAVAALRAGYQPADEAAVAGILQPIALAPWGWTAMRQAHACLVAVRQELAGSESVTAPPRLERFRWRTILSSVGLTVAAYILVGQLSKVNLAGAFESMTPGWFLVALAASAATYFGAALNLAAFVPQRLSMLRGFWVQLSTSFVGVAMPPTVGHVAVNSRYLHRQGVNEATVTAAVALSQIVNVVTTIPLLVVIGILTGSGISKFKIVPGTDVLVAAGCVAAGIGVMAAIPPTRRLIARTVWAHIRSVIPRLLEALSEPLRLGGSIAGDLILTGGYVAALYASLVALGAHPSVLGTAAVYLAGNTVGSFAPTPGGLGAVELVLTAGLTGIGIPAHEAVAAVLLFRFATFWLPIPAGWISFVLLQRAGTL